MLERILHPVEGCATQHIQQAIDACFQAGGGQVTLTDGVYPVGSVRLRSNVTLYLQKGVRLVASRDMTQYRILNTDTLEPLCSEDQTDVRWSRANPQRDNSFIRKAGSPWADAIIRLVRAENVKIIAEPGAIIDGQNSYDPLGEEHYRGAHGISAYHCRNLEFSGYTIQDTGNWAHCLYYCQDLTFTNLEILAGHDGIHVTGCDRIHIANCRMYTGDDCVAGFDNHDMQVEDCLFNTACSVFRLGGCNVHIRHCQQTSPARFCFRGSLTPEEKAAGAPSQTGRKTTLSAFTYYSDFTMQVRHQPGQIRMENCRFENLERLIHYNFSGNEPWQCNRPLESLSLDHITAEGVGMSLCAYGAEEVPFTLHLTHSHIGFAAPVTEVIRSCHWKLLDLTGTEVTPLPPCVVRSWSDEGQLVQELLPSQPVVKAEEPFHTKAI